ncbi:MAG: MoxR family ATPase, partial [Oleibacter sp.]|nr:MoxR family ATPase [Thalassolituus sp.]
PMSQSGTFNLPESQLDRFMMRLHLGYPTPKAERALFEGDNQRHMLAKIVPAMTVSQLKVLRQRVGQVKASPAILDYLQRILAFTREDGGFAYGLSPRGGLSLLRAARSWALVNGRDYLLPEDIQQVLATVVNHRLGDSHHASAADHILNRVQVLA